MHAKIEDLKNLISSHFRGIWEKKYLFHISFIFLNFKILQTETKGANTLYASQFVELQFVVLWLTSYKMFKWGQIRAVEVNHVPRRSVVFNFRPPYLRTLNFPSSVGPPSLHFQVTQTTISSLSTLYSCDSIIRSFNCSVSHLSSIWISQHLKFYLIIILPDPGHKYSRIASTWCSSRSVHNFVVMSSQ